MSARYVKCSEQDLVCGSRAVVPWNDGVVFRCPCDDRQVYIATPPHEIAFDAEGVLTVNQSMGYRAKPNMDPPRPQNWCHFHIKQGNPTMCDDAQCPGAGR